MLLTEILLFSERWSITELESWANGTQKEVSFKDILQSCGISFLFLNKFSSFWGDMRNVELDGVRVTSKNFDFIVTKLSFFRRELSLDCSLESKVNDKVLKLKQEGNMYIDGQPKPVKVKIKSVDDSNTRYTVNKNFSSFFDVVPGTKITLKCKISYGPDIEVPTFLVPIPSSLANLNPRFAFI